MKAALAVALNGSAGECQVPELIELARRDSSSSVGNADNAQTESSAGEAPDFSWFDSFGWLDSTQATVDVANAALDLSVYWAGRQSHR